MLAVNLSSSKLWELNNMFLDWIWQPGLPKFGLGYTRASLGTFGISRAAFLHASHTGSYRSLWYVALLGGWGIWGMCDSKT